MKLKLLTKNKDKSNKARGNTKKKLSEQNIKTIGNIFNIGLFTVIFVCLVLISFDVYSRNTLIKMNTQYLKVEYLQLKEKGSESDYKEVSVIDTKPDGLLSNNLTESITCKVGDSTKTFSLNNIVYVKGLPKYNSACINDNLFIKYDRNVAFTYILNINLLHIAIISFLAVIVTLYMSKVKQVHLWSDFVIYLYSFEGLFSSILALVILFQAEVV